MIFLKNKYRNKCGITKDFCSYFGLNFTIIQWFFQMTLKVFVNLITFQLLHSTIRKEWTLALSFKNKTKSNKQKKPCMFCKIRFQKGKTCQVPRKSWVQSLCQVVQRDTPFQQRGRTGVLKKKNRYLCSEILS